MWQAVRISSTCRADSLAQPEVIASVAEPWYAAAMFFTVCVASSCVGCTAVAKLRVSNANSRSVSSSI